MGRRLSTIAGAIGYAASVCADCRGDWGAWVAGVLGVADGLEKAREEGWPGSGSGVGAAFASELLSTYLRGGSVWVRKEHRRSLALTLRLSGRDGNVQLSGPNSCGFLRKSSSTLPCGQAGSCQSRPDGEDVVGETCGFLRLRYDLEIWLRVERIGEIPRLRWQHDERSSSGFHLELAGARSRIWTLRVADGALFLQAVVHDHGVDGAGGVT